MGNRRRTRTEISLSAATAAELLSLEPEAGDLTPEERAWVHWNVQMQIIPSAWRGEGPEPPGWNAASRKLSAIDRHPKFAGDIHAARKSSEHSAVMRDLQNAAREELETRKREVAQGKRKTIWQ